MKQNNKISLLKLLTVFSSIIAVLAYAYSHQAIDVKQLTASDVSSETPVSPKTAQLTLPERTNNVWQMKPFTLPDTKGNTHTLKDWQGKVIMLNFWASWCSPCQFEIPRFVNYQKRYAQQGLQIIGIGLDEQKKLANVERSLEMNYPTLVISQQEGGKLLEKWGNDQGIVPYTAVIATDGTIVYIHRGSMEDEDFNEFVLPLLSKK